MGAGLEARLDHAPGQPTIDGLGIFFMIFASLWTLILAGGMYFLYKRRDMPILRIRGLPLSFGAVILLHMYWLAVQTGYIYGPWMAPSIEFWIMGIWFPFGIALFHASNSRFLYVAEMQKRFISTDQIEPMRRPTNKKKTLMQRYRSLDYTTRMLTLVCAGMAFQLFLTFFMFVVSRKFHNEFGIAGTEVTGTWEEQKAAASKGWEWWPSVFWQCFWAWIVAPLILWRSRGLHDTLGWRVQTIGCCIAGLHATPMWLIALYVPAMAPVNKYWIPPQWIAISIMMLEIFTIFIPVWEVIKHQSLRHETLESIARWEARNKGKPTDSIETGSSYVSWAKPRRSKAVSVHSSSNNSVLTMDALEHTLEKNPEPLQQFSALKDFSGENIAFLRRVHDWRAKYYAIKGFERKMSVISEKNQAPPSPTTQVDIRSSFEEALKIYIDFISSRGAEFQINLSSPDFKKLAAVFEHAARIVYGDDRTPDPALPFETPDWRVGPKSPGIESSSPASPTTPKSEETAIEDIRYWGDIPEEFGEDVFDDSEMSIKYLVLTNTWPKYVKARRSMDSIDALEAAANMA